MVGSKVTANKVKFVSSFHFLRKHNIIYTKTKSERMSKMLSYIIEGGRRLEGETFVSGSKNASLPIIAGTLLNSGVSRLYNVPNIHDTQMMFEILKKLGCKVRRNNGKIIVDSNELISDEIPNELMRQMRSSVVMVGAMLRKNEKSKILISTEDVK